MKELTGNNLAEMLWETLQAVKAGDVANGQAAAVAELAREINRTRKVQHYISQQAGHPISSKLFDFAEK